MHKLGIMGGTFDPIHYGHLIAAEIARDELSLGKIVFIPAARPPHKPERVAADPWLRYRMVDLAIASNPFFALSSIEIERPGLSYTVDTLRAMGERYSEAEIYFITGADAVLEITTWREPEKLLSMCYFVAVSRPGYHLDKLWQRAAALIPDPEQRILGLEIPETAISSTDIRRRVRKGKTIKYLLPEAVESFIAGHKLYYS